MLQGSNAIAEATPSLNSPTGALPQTPGFCALPPSPKLEGSGRLVPPASSVFGPGAALGLLPSRALSSDQVGLDSATVQPSESSLATLPTQVDQLEPN